MDSREIRNCLAEVIGNLKAGGFHEDVESLLKNREFLHERISVYGVSEALKDFSDIASHDVDKIRTVLIQSQHILHQFPGQAKSQLDLRLGAQFFSQTNRKRVSPQIIPLKPYLAGQNNQLIKTIPVEWKRSGFADRKFPKLILSDDEQSVFVTYPDSCNVREFSLDTGAELNRINLQYTYFPSVEPDTQQDSISATEKFEGDKILLALNSKNEEDGQITQYNSKLVICDVENKSINNLIFHDRNRISFIFWDQKRNRIILVTIKDVIFICASSYDVLKAIKVETHKNAYIEDAAVNDDALILVSRGQITAIRLSDFLVHYQHGLREFTNDKLDIFDAVQSFYHPILFNNCAYGIVSKGKRSYLFDPLRGTTIKPVCGLAGRVLGTDEFINRVFVTSDNQLFQYGPETDTQKLLFHGINGSFELVKLIPSRQQLLTLHDDGNLRVWNYSDVSSGHTFQHAASIAGIVTINSHRYISWCKAGRVVCWDFSDETRCIIEDQESPIVAIKVHPSRRLFVVGRKSGEINIWNSGTLKLHNSYKFKAGFTGDTSLYDFEFSPDGFQIYIINWDGLSSASIHTHKVRHIYTKESHFTEHTVHPLEDGQHIIIISDNRRIRLLDAYLGTIICDFGGTGGSWRSPRNEVEKLHKVRKLAILAANSLIFVDIINRSANTIDSHRDRSLFFQLPQKNLIISNKNSYLDVMTGKFVFPHVESSSANIHDITSDDAFILSSKENSVIVSSTVDPSADLSLVTDSEIQCGQFLHDAQMLIVGDKMGNVMPYKCIGLNHLKIQDRFSSRYFTHPIKNKVINQPEHYFLADEYGFKYSKEHLSYDNDPICLFCNSTANQVYTIGAKCVCLECESQMPPKPEWNFYPSRYNIQCRLCSIKEEKNSEEKIEFCDILLQRICRNCLGELELKKQLGEFEVHQELNQNNPVSVVSPLLFWKKKKKPKRHFQYLEKPLRRKKPEAIKRLASFLGSHAASEKIANAMHTKVIKSLHFDEKETDASDEIKAIQISLGELRTEKEIELLASLLPKTKTPYPWVRYANAVYAFPREWISRAQKAAEYALKLNSTFAPAWKILAKIHSERTFDILTAIEAYENYFECGGNDYSNFFLNGAKYALNALYKEEVAEELYESSLASDSASPKTIINFALFLLYTKQDVTRAKLMYDLAIEKNPKFVEHFGDFDNLVTNSPAVFHRAEHLFEAALSASPNDVEVLTTFAGYLWQIKKEEGYVRAEELFEEAYQTGKAKASAIGDYATLMTDICGDYKKAQQLFEAAIELEPNHPINLSNYANFSRKVLKDFELAKSLFEAAKKTGKESVIGLSNYAIFLSHDYDDIEGAIKIYQEAIQEYPKNPVLHGNLAQLLFLQGETDSAVENLKISEEADSKNDELNLELAFYRYAHLTPFTLNIIKPLIVRGVRCLDWPLEKNFTRALVDGHPNPKLLQAMIEVISSGAEIDTLRNFEEWNIA